MKQEFKQGDRVLVRKSDLNKAKHYLEMLIENMEPAPLDYEYVVTNKS